MKTETFSFTGAQGMMLPAKLWLPEESPRLLLQITHGMTEHMGRYTVLAEALTAQGIAVAGFDLRGHGANPGDPDCASFGENGWEYTLEDMYLFYQLMEQRFPELPHFMFGFSLGSFLLREFLGRYDTNTAGAVIMGTGQQPAAVLSIIMAIVKTQIKLAGFDSCTPLVRKLSFDTYNQKFAPNRTDADWLCSDLAQLDAYLYDPLCRKNISSGLFWQLLSSMRRTGRKKAYENWNSWLPILLLSGKKDPVGDFQKGVIRVSKQMEEAGLGMPAVYLIPDARHDLLHEEANGQAPWAREILVQWLLDQI